MTFAAGDLIGTRYRLDELIGTGGMGQVFRAHDTVLARPVAIKLVDAVEPRRREEITQGFLREARISAAIDHRNVVRILDFGTHASTVPFMVMELLEGESLGDVLGRGDKLPFEWLLAVVTQVLEGLAAAHEAGVVHRDLKPENIFLVRERGTICPKILDFGISKFLDSNGTARVTTAHGHVVGTPAYMSPEQARGVRQIDQRSDIYSIGVVLYELLCGEMPFFSENPGDLMLMIITTEAKPLVERVPDIGQPLSDLVARAMSKRPEDRFAGARELHAALIAASEQMLGSAAMKRLGERLRPPPWRQRGHEVETLSESPADATPGRSRAAHDPTAIMSRPGLSNRRWMLPALGAGALALALGLVALWFNRSSADSAPRFIVVTADQKPALAATTQPALTATQPTEEPPSALEPKPEPAAPSARKARPGPRGTADVLGDTFRRQKTSVVACLNAHSEEAEKLPRLAVRFAVAREGQVERASVLPAELSSTALGTCIERAARSMRFPPQTQPIAFEVPLTARKGG